MKYFFLSIILFTLFSCKKVQEKVKVSDIVNESNYKITYKKENDTITQIHGENKQYTLKGYKDIKNNVKVGWWEVEDKQNNYLYKIEYISLDKNKENQVKFYMNNKLINKYSQYYDIIYSNGIYQFKFYFQEYNNEDIKIEFGYITSDGSTPPLRKTIICKKENDYYTCFIPVKDKNQLIAGIVTEFATSNEVNEKILLSSKSMYVNTTSR
ncbi:hypothetical protein [Chryseobacterium arthrosphaerae]|nr:hypothetical protein [Chryseobacterium arthrosphaerae]